MDFSHTYFKYKVLAQAETHSQSALGDQLVIIKGPLFCQYPNATSTQPFDLKMTLHPTTNHHTNLMSAISQLLPTWFWPNYKVRFPEPFKMDSNCNDDICLRLQELFEPTIFLDQKILWTNFFRCVSISIKAKFTNRQTDKHTLSPVWLCMTLYDCVWLCMTKYDYVWLCMTTYVWLCITIYEWLCVTIYDFVWLCMNMY